MSRRPPARSKTRSEPRRRSTWDEARPDARPDRLSRERIVATAIAIADADGLAAVSIRNVAERLGASPMALYNHVPTKQDLLNLMLDAAHAELTVRPDQVTDWRAGFTAVAWEMRRSLQRHPWLMAIRSGGAEHGPAYMRGFELALGMGRHFGIAEEPSARILGALSAAASGLVPSATGRNFPVLSRALLQSGEFPLLAQLVASTTAPSGDELFAEVVGWILDGVAARLTLP